MKIEKQTVSYRFSFTVLSNKNSKSNSNFDFHFSNNSFINKFKEIGINYCFSFCDTKIKIRIVLSFSVFNLIKRKKKNEWRCDRLGARASLLSYLYLHIIFSYCPVICLFKDILLMSVREDDMDIAKFSRRFYVDLQHQVK